MAKRFRSKAKKTQKISKGTLIEKNSVTGEEKTIGQRGQEFDLSASKTVPDNKMLNRQTESPEKHRHQASPTADVQTAADSGQADDFRCHDNASVSTQQVPRQESFSPSTSQSSANEHKRHKRQVAKQYQEQFADDSHSPKVQEFALPENKNQGIDSAHNAGIAHEQSLISRKSESQYADSVPGIPTVRRDFDLRENKSEQQRADSEIHSDSTHKRESTLRVNKQRFMREDSRADSAQRAQKKKSALRKKNKQRVLAENQRGDSALQTSATHEQESYEQETRLQKDERVDQGADTDTSVIPASDEQEFDLREHRNGGQSTKPSSVRAKQHGSIYAKKFGDGLKKEETALAKASSPLQHEQSIHEDAKIHESASKESTADSDAVKTDSAQTTAANKKAARRLQFSSDELPPQNKKLQKAEQRLAKTLERSETAQAALPSKKSPTFKKELDEASGNMKRKLRFEEKTKSVNEHVRGALPLRPAKFAADRTSQHAHRKIQETEHENVGTEAFHKGEKLAERGVRKAYRWKKSESYRKAARLQTKAVKLQKKAAYERALHNNPQLKSNLFSRLNQKRKIRKEYAQALKGAKRSGNVVKRVASSSKKVVTKVVQAIRSNPKILAIIGIGLLLIIIICSIVSSCSTIATGVMSGIASSTYQAADADINKAELLYQQWEVDLQLQIGKAEQSHAGYDDYQFEVDDIGHDPYELIAFLTAVYGSYEFDNIQAVLREIFDEQYQLTFTPEVLPDGTRVLKVKLVAKSFSDVIASRMTAEQKQVYDTLMETLGNRQYLVNPFDFNWLNRITSPFGHRIHPVTGVAEFHTGIDITVPAGTVIKAGHDGVVVKAEFDSVYGNFVLLDNGQGLQSRYAQCATLLVAAGQNVKKGDPIATVGNTGSGANGLEPHLHLEVMKDGQYLNPLFFGETGSVGDSSPLFPDNPGAAMGDGTYQAMIAEAEKHLGKPYVFGTKGPNTFDCSSYVSWVLDKSGVRPGEMHDAQGWYNTCTPVSPENAKPGDLIFFQGTYSTHKTVTHIGIYIGNGQMIHCGKPVQYASINTPYWKKHFYSFGRL